MEILGYCVRVQALDGYGEKIRMLVTVPDYQSIAAIQHKGGKGENAHYHLVVKTTVKEQAFRVRLKKVFDLGKGNEHMSLKAWDGSIDAISYLFHEDPDGPLFLQHNVTDELVAKARERNKQVQEKVALAKERASWKIEEYVYEQLKGTKPTLHEIAHAIVLYALRNDKYVPNDFLLKAMASKIEFRLLDKDLDKEDEFAKLYVSRVYRMDYDQERAWLAGGRG